MNWSDWKRMTWPDRWYIAWRIAAMIAVTVGFIWTVALVVSESRACQNAGGDMYGKGRTVCVVDGKVINP